MKIIDLYISEKLKINNDVNAFHYHPKNELELRLILVKLLNERGKDANLNDIDISNLDYLGPLNFDEYPDYWNYEKDLKIPKNFNGDLLGIFDGLDPHNIDISQWDVSNVSDMDSLFENCKNFDCDLSSWNVSNVYSFTCMFNNCENFKGKGLENWNVSNSEDISMEYMFDGCSKLRKTPKWYHE